MIAAACFALLLSLGVEPVVYNKHTARNATDCMGDACFAVSHYVAASLGAVAVLIAVNLHLAVSKEHLSTLPSMRPIPPQGAVLAVKPSIPKLNYKIAL